MLDKISKIQILLLGLVLGAFMLLCTFAISGNISKDEISVTGTAYQIVKSDSAKWDINYNVEAPSRTDAYNKLSKIEPVIKKFLLDNGIKENEITMGQISSYPNYRINPATGYSTQEIRSYTYNQDVAVRSSDVELVKKLQNEIQSLVQQGVVIANSNVNYYYSKMTDKKAELLSLATLDAKNRASGMLKATHNSVGKMRSVKMGIFQITQPESNDVSDWGINDTSTIEKKITAVANVVFAIK